nr:MAG TPA: hypothetical protein [Caudoviricetes sp.]
MAPHTQYGTKKHSPSYLPIFQNYEQNLRGVSAPLFY